MERLTYDFVVGGNHCWQIHGADNELCEDVCKRYSESGCKNCPIGHAFDRLAAYEDTGLEPEAVEQLKLYAVGKAVAETEVRTIDGMPLGNVVDLIHAEQDGRLVVLPCKVGDTVYLTGGDRVIEAEVTCIRPFVFRGKTEFRGNVAWRFENPFYNDGRILEQDVFVVFGKSAYLTREEAEAALKGG